MTIPKIIHQIYWDFSEQNKPIPEKWKKFHQSWKDNFPEPENIDQYPFSAYITQVSEGIGVLSPYISKLIELLNDVNNNLIFEVSKNVYIKNDLMIKGSMISIGGIPSIQKINTERGNESFEWRPFIIILIFWHNYSFIYIYSFYSDQTSKYCSRN